MTRDAPTGDGRLVGTVAEAVQAWNALPANPQGRIGLITIMDSRTYAADYVGAQAIVVPPGQPAGRRGGRLARHAGPRASRRPGGASRASSSPPICARTCTAVSKCAGRGPVGTAVAGEVVLDGLLIEGALAVLAGNLGSLRVADCTLVPGLGLDADSRPIDPVRPSIVVDPANTRLRLLLDHSVCGPLHLPPTMTGLDVRDNIVDLPARGGRAGLWPALVSGEPVALRPHVRYPGGPGHHRR